MKMSEEFTSKYLKAADLQGREVRVTMQNVEREKVGDDTKPVLYFKGKDKGFVLNRTNSNTIVDAYGDDSEDWFDQPLILFSVMVDFQGKVGPAIRCRVPTAKDNKRRDPISSGVAQHPVFGDGQPREPLNEDPSGQRREPMTPHPMDDEIPF